MQRKSIWIKVPAKFMNVITFYLFSLPINVLYHSDNGHIFA